MSGLSAPPLSSSRSSSLAGSPYTDFPGRFEPVAGTDRYTASEDLAWDIGRLGSGLTIVVPALYEHDVSVPPTLSWAADRHDPRFQRAARLHDWLLDCGWSAWTSAAVFYDALKADRVGRARRWGMALAVLGFIAKRDARAGRATRSRPLTTSEGGQGRRPPRPTR